MISEFWEFWQARLQPPSPLATRTNQLSQKGSRNPPRAKKNSNRSFGEIEGRWQVFRLDLLHGCETAQVGETGEVRRVVHFADLLEFVALEIDTDLALAPRLLQDCVVADKGRARRSAVAVELHVADGPVNDCRRQTVRQPLKGRAVHAFAIVHQRLQGGDALQGGGVSHHRLCRAWLFVLARADGKDQQPILARGPAEPVSLQRGQHQKLQRWVIEWGDAAIDKGAIDDFAVAGVDSNFFWREIGRGRRAGANYLREAQRPILGGVFSPSPIVQRPRASGIEPLGHDHEASADFGAVERRVRAELSVELGLERLGGKLGAKFSLQGLRQELTESARLEDIGAQLFVDSLQRADGHATGESCGDDRSGRGSSDEIEIIAHQSVVAEPLFDQGLYRL